LADSDVVGGEWKSSLDTSLLGLGEVRLHAEMHYPGGLTFRSRHISLQVDHPKGLLPASNQADKPVREGIRAVLDMNDGRQETLLLPGLPGGRGSKEWRILSPDMVTLSGAFEARAEGLYELDLMVKGRLSVFIGDMAILGNARLEDDERTLIPLLLAKGWHRFEIKYQPGEGNELPRVALMGEEPAFVLDGHRVGF
jgi:hypothetical protein